MYASASRYSPEIVKLIKIDRFGLEAITGRKVFYVSEYRRLIVAENIVAAFRMREKAKNWVDWMKENKELAGLLHEAENLANATG